MRVQDLEEQRLSPKKQIDKEQLDWVNTIEPPEAKKGKVQNIKEAFADHLGHDLNEPEAMTSQKIKKDDTDLPVEYY